MMSKQTKQNYGAIMRLYNVYFSLCSNQDFVGMSEVYNLLTSIYMDVL